MLLVNSWSLLALDSCCQVDRAVGWREEELPVDILSLLAPDIYIRLTG
jgi:hypothetical protein